ncbi:hypothetical protein [Chryseobacterium sp. SIMBA_029]|uniref:hypothetical protein n=1 Tax=Chryseobacterium sp. SIMBA_029 TaxID=3085772 RepID=UPI00397E597B
MRNKETVTVFLFLLGFTSASAQVGVNTTNPKATLDVVGNPSDITKIDGLIAPRLTGDELAAKDALYAAPQTGTQVYATAPAGTPTAKTINVTTPGYYYFDGAVWQKFAGGAASSEPWYNQATDTEATDNTQNIYQSGNVAIGKTDNYTDTALDVQGSVRGGSGQMGTVGNNSFAFGFGNEASGQYSAALGYQSVASGNYGAFAVGNTNTASGQSAVALGNNTLSSGAGSISMGQTTNAQGTGSVAIGQGTSASSLGEVSLGIANSVTTGSAFTSVSTDALFQLGNGSSNGTTVFSRNNAVTVLKNAHTAIGVDGAEAVAKPTELLDLGGTASTGNGGLRIRNINSPAYTGNMTTDKVVVADTNGVLKAVAPSSITGTNIYNSDGTLLTNRIVTMGTNTLQFKNGSNSITFSNVGTQSFLTASGSSRGAFRAQGGSAILDMFVDNANSAQLVTSGNATSLNLGTQSATPVNFFTNNTQRATVNPVGNFGINTINPTHKLHVVPSAGDDPVRIEGLNTASGAENNVVVDLSTGILKYSPTVAQPLFHAKLAANQTSLTGTNTILLGTPEATSSLYSYNITTGVMTFNSAGNYLVQMQMSFRNVGANEQVIIGIRDAGGNFIGRGSTRIATSIAASATVGQIHNYNTVISVTAGQQITFAANGANTYALLRDETGAIGTGNVSNITIIKL